MSADGTTPVGPGAGRALSVRAHYRSGRDDLAEDFFRPCIAAARLYRRSTGYFSSGALLTWTDGLRRLGSDREFEVRLIASPELSVGDRDTLRGLEDEGRLSALRAVIAEAMLDEIAELARSPGDAAVRARVFAWLVATERLRIRFAFPRHVDDAGMFHEKMGVFDLDGGARVAFTGSANETARGHRRNYESVDVFRTWVEAERERVATKVEQFDEAWDNEAPGLQVLSPSPDVVARLRAVAGERRPGPAPAAPADARWRHQEEALEAFVAAGAGVLEMATGTGKTRTALKILARLVADGRIDTAVFATDGTDLLDQWATELEEWSADAGGKWLVFRHYERHRGIGEYVLDPDRALMVVSRGQLRRLLDRVGRDVARRALVVHDEVHGLGGPDMVGRLAGRHAAFAWRLGLSATPERAYDQAGNDFILSEIGPTIFSFPLEAAIARGVLAEFDYLPLRYDLTQADRERLQGVYSRKSARARDGNPMSNEEFWTEISKVYKTAEMKPDVFREFIKKNPKPLERCIVFVETREYGERVLEIIDERTHRYRTYYAEDDREHLVSFARGEIDCLVTCHRISQGIDIRSLRTVVLFASARARLETVQRIGRCLRYDPASPDKRALVVDFVRPPAPGDMVPNADQDRAAWLAGLSRVRKGDAHGAG